MITRLSKKRAISTVLTTVIILVSSVVLGSGVVLYGTSLFQSGTQTEAISSSGIKVWVNTEASNGIAMGAAKVRNTGDKVISIDQIQIRGDSIPFSQWFPDTTVDSNTFQQALNHTGWASATGGSMVFRDITACDNTLEVDLDWAGAASTVPVCADAASGPVALSPGQSAIIYFKLNNGTLTSLDSGVNTSVNIYAGKSGAPQSVTVQGLAP